MPDGFPSDSAGARWPQDWPHIAALETYHPPFGGRDIPAGSMILGRTLPAGTGLGDQHYGRDYSCPVVLDPADRLRHVAILGPTGKGKSVRFVIPTLVRDMAQEDGPCDVVVDVKSPQVCSLLGPMMEQRGRPLHLLDPWSPESSARIEPLWDATPRELDVIEDALSRMRVPMWRRAEADATMSPEHRRYLRALLESVRLLPRHQCSLPNAQRLISDGPEAIVLALESALAQMPGEEQVQESLAILAGTQPSRLRTNILRAEERRALVILESAGPEAAALLLSLIKNTATVEQANSVFESIEARRQGILDAIRFWRHMSETGDKMLVLEALTDCREALQHFSVPEVRAMFAGPGIDLGSALGRPGLLVIGAPLAKMRSGSTDIASLLVRLVGEKVIHRGKRIESDERVPVHAIHLILDEVTNLDLPDLPVWAAVFRGFRAGIVALFQDRAQIKARYGDRAPQIEANFCECVVLEGCHSDTAEWVASVVEKSAGGKRLLSVEDVVVMRINGERRAGLAISIGCNRPPHILRTIPYYEDTSICDLLEMERVDRDGTDRMVPAPWSGRTEGGGCIESSFASVFAAMLERS